MQTTATSTIEVGTSSNKTKSTRIDQDTIRNPNAPPKIVALFLVRFDVKKGYVIDWQRTASNAVPLDMVEFKVFPSGLHNSKSDVIYFVQGDAYSGVSVYIQLETADKTERFSRMYSLGILVPSGTLRRGRVSYGATGRLGRSWAHVEALKDLLLEYTADPSDFGALEQYYSIHGIITVSSPVSTPNSSAVQPETAIYNPPRRPFELNSSKLKGYPQLGTQTSSSTQDNDTDSLGPSGTTNALPPILPKSHPAYSLPSFLDTFGPLVFKVWKAALARERILIVGDIPIEQGCSFVYDIALLANIPNAIAEMLPIPAYRIRPLFAVGVYDLDYLKSLSALTPAEEARQKRPSPYYGWVAYTTDKIIQDKTDLFDVLIRLPPLSASMHAAAQAVIPSRPESPRSSSGHSAVYFPVNEMSARILYPVVHYSSHPKEHLKASIRDMRRFQSLERQIGYSIDPRQRWYRQFYQQADELEEQTTELERRITASSGSSSGFPQDQTGRMPAPPSGEIMALLAASEEITAAANVDIIYNDDPELFFSTRTDLQTEQPSWKQLTWLGFLWWASAGEEARIDEEELSDVIATTGLENNDTTTSLDHVFRIKRGDTRPLLLDDSVSRSSSIAATPMAMSNEESFTYLSPFQDLTQLDEELLKRGAAAKKTSAADADESDDETATMAAAAAVESSKQVAIIAIFHRFTARIFSVLARLIQEQSLVVTRVEPRRKRRTADESMSDTKQTLWISKVDMLAMGLDPWSESDSKFINTVIERWWGGQIEARRDNEFLNSVTFCC
ncbi:hypothetical protein V1512DRAFT_267375 [Lipomyces arxii]|uniref:uncharacterized protein n=1 Tax=Lipomyces arxii TaxID=56418 RepID=UPI0034CDDBB6